MRPKDENGRTLPAAHKRLENANALVAAGFEAIKDDSKLAHLPLKKKLRLCDSAVDMVFDGGKQPKWTFGRGGDTAISDAFRRACRAISEAR